VPVPEDLPAIAIRQPGLYRLEVALLIFYSWLLLVTPAVSGLVRGRLPIEISTRGAKFAEETSHSEALNEQRIEELERTAEAHGENLTRVHREIKQLKGKNEGDSTQAGIDSKQ
jgi:hypothetical protein